MSRFINLIGSIFGFAALVCALCISRTLYLNLTRPLPPPPCEPNEKDGYIESGEAWERFKGALKIESVSFKPHEYNRAELKRLLTYLRESYPTVFKSRYVQSEVVNGYSLLLSVRGRDSSLKPFLLTAHLDVVPVIQSEWSWDGFGAEEADNGSIVYARGALDNKGSVIGQLEALNFLLSRGQQPKRSFFIAFGHDEEVGGEDGALKIAETLRKRGIDSVAFLLDEGMPITKGVFPGMQQPITGIGVTEKGSLFLNISVRTEGGHSSLPPKQSSIGILSEAIAKLEANPAPLIMDDLTQSLLQELSFEMSFPLNVICSNLWLFKPIVAWFMARGKSVVLVRTTTAVTMVGGGIKQNVIPPSAWAVVNHRIHPSQTIAEVVEYDKRIINDDRVQIEIMRGKEAHPISPHDPNRDAAYHVISKAFQQTYPTAHVVPITMTANTDTIHYLNFTKNVFRVIPFVVESKDLYRIHGRDERLHRKYFEAALNFYYHVMLNADDDDLRAYDREAHSEL